MRLGRGQKEGQLPPGPVLPHQGTPRRQEGDPCSGSLHAAIYHMLKDGTMYQDLGRNYFDRRSNEAQKQRLVKRLAELGYAAELTPFTA